MENIKIKMFYYFPNKNILKDIFSCNVVRRKTVDKYVQKQKVEKHGIVNAFRS